MLLRQKATYPAISSAPPATAAGMTIHYRLIAAQATPALLTLQPEIASGRAHRSSA
jgi:hypothetical protein